MTIGPIKLPTRIVADAHSVPGRWPECVPAQAAYQAARARGGAAMCVLGGGGVHPSSPGPIPTAEDRVIDGLGAVAEAVHAAGGRLVQQLRHSGSAKADGRGGTPWSCSPVPHPALGVVPQPMSQAMIEEVVAAFAAAADRVRSAGFDGVEIHGASGYLINQFLSPASNHRSDAYGGSTENRTRFAAEVLAAVRARVGDSFVVGLRLTAEEYVGGGLHPPEVHQIALALTPLVDYIHVAVGGSWRPDAISPAEPLGAGAYPEQAAVTRSMRVPTVVGGRVRSLSDAAAMIESGVCDLVAMTRALLADPSAARPGAAAGP